MENQEKPMINNKVRVAIIILIAAIAGLGFWAYKHKQLAVSLNSGSANGPITVSGELTVIHSDNFNVDAKGEPNKDPGTWKSNYEYSLKTDKGEDLKLEFPAGKGPELLSQSKITVSGNREGKTIKLASSGGADLKVDYQALPHHSPRKVAVIVLKWADNLAEPAPLDLIKKQFFTDPVSINSYYKDTSYSIRTLLGKNDPNGDVYGYYTIPVGTSCGSSITGIGYTAATAAGADLSGYDNYVYIMTSSHGCPWSGIAALGGNWAISSGISQYGFNQQVAAHELGHNFGVDHANGMFCTDTSGFQVAISSNCVFAGNQEYQDPYEVMGNSNYRQMNSIHKGFLGWFQPSNMQIVTSSGDYTVAPLDSPSTAVQMLQVIPPSKGKTVPKSYFVDYRQPYGNFGVYDLNGVLLHYNNSFDLRTNLIFATPATPDNVNRSQALKVGKTFVDPATQVSITTLSTSSTGAVVRVKYGSPAINNASCIISSAPKVVKPGSSFSANMTVKNTGTIPWTVTDYKLNSVELIAAPYVGQPKEIKSSNLWGPTDVNISSDITPGQTTVISTNLTAPATPAAYTFAWRMKQYSQNEWFGATCESVIVVNEDTTPPTAASNLRITDPTANSLTLAWDPATDNVGVVGYKVYRQKAGGKTTPFALVGYSFLNTYKNEGLAAATSYNYYVIAYDAVGSESSASSTVTGKTLSATTTASSLSLKMVIDNNANGLPNYGDTITFNVTTTAASPHVKVDCYQGSAFVYHKDAGFYDLYPWSKDFLLGATTAWTSGAAECTATMYTSRDGIRETTIATLNFHVDP